LIIQKKQPVEENYVTQIILSPHNLTRCSTLKSTDTFSPIDLPGHQEMIHDKLQGFGISNQII